MELIVCLEDLLVQTFAGIWKVWMERKSSITLGKKIKMNCMFTKISTSLLAVLSHWIRVKQVSFHLSTLNIGHSLNYTPPLYLADGSAFTKSSGLLQQPSLSTVWKFHLQQMQKLVTSSTLIHSNDQLAVPVGYQLYYKVSWQINVSQHWWKKSLAATHSFHLLIYSELCDRHTCQNSSDRLKNNLVTWWLTWLLVTQPTKPIRAHRIDFGF